MAEAAPELDRAPRGVALARLAIGFAQGVGLYLLSEAATRKVWPATVAWLFDAAALVLAFVPLVVIGGLGRIRPRALTLWTLFAVAALAAFGWHDADAGIWSGLYDPAKLGPAFQVWLFSAVFLFVGHHLVGPADEARRLVAPYRVYFDWAWKDGVQLGLAALFVGVLWLALELGAGLFNLIGVNALEQLIKQRWFSLPVSFMAFAAAVQLTDVRVGLIRGVRTVGLTLLAWLLPVMTVIVIAFLAALPFTGLAPLFGTRSGAATVLSAAAALIVLVSAAYQDGGARVAIALRYAGRAAALALVPLILIAADAIAQRVGQYGFSPERIEAIACAVVGAGFAAGYAAGAVRRRGPWTRLVEPTNVLMARVTAALILVMFTPLADPARLAVDDQVGRLLAGATAPGKFDFDFLHFRAGRYGAEALARLERVAGTPRNLAIAKAARLAALSEYVNQPPVVPPEARFHVYPAGAVLPPGFAAQLDARPPPNIGAVFVADYLPCAGHEAAGSCDAYVVDIDGDGHAEVLLGNEPGADILTLHVFKQDPSGAWADIGRLLVRCHDALDQLRAGRFTAETRSERVAVIGGKPQLLVPIDPTPCQAPAAR